MHIINNEFNKNNHCILLYEEFINNHDYILDKLQIFYGEEYSKETRDYLKNKLDINNVKKIIENKNYHDFKQYDKNTHFHGNHISKFNGNTDYTKILNENLLTILKENIILNQIIEKYYKSTE